MSIKLDLLTSPNHGMYEYFRKKIMNNIYSESREDMNQFDVKSF